MSVVKTLSPSSGNCGAPPFSGMASRAPAAGSTYRFESRFDSRRGAEAMAPYMSGRVRRLAALGKALSEL